MLTDKMLLDQIIERDSAALEQLYDRHAGPVYHLILRIVKVERLAEEILQDVFWRAWENATAFRGDGEVAAWLYRIARNRSLDELRKTVHKTEVAHDDFTMEQASTNVERTVQRRWTQTTVQDALKNIPPEQRDCLQLAYFGGMSQSAIATELDLPLGTVKTRTRLGMQKLANLLQQAGVENR